MLSDALLGGLFWGFEGFEAWLVLRGGSCGVLVEGCGGIGLCGWDGICGGGMWQGKGTDRQMILTVLCYGYDLGVGIWGCVFVYA